jgi:hypothetical protein
MAHLSGSNDLVTEKTKCMRVPSRKVRDVANDAELELLSHREAQTLAQAQRAHAVQPIANTVASSSTTSFASSAPSASVPVLQVLLQKYMVMMAMMVMVMKSRPQMQNRRVSQLAVLAVLFRMSTIFDR